MYFLAVISSIWLATWTSQLPTIFSGEILKVIPELLEAVAVCFLAGVVPMVLIGVVISLICGVFDWGDFDSINFWVVPNPGDLSVPKKDGWRISAGCVVLFALGTEASMLLTGFISLIANRPAASFLTVFICIALEFGMWLLIHKGQIRYIWREENKFRAAQKAAAEEKARRQREAAERERQERERQRAERHAAEQKRLRIRSEHERQFYEILGQQYGLRIASIVANGYTVYDIKGMIQCDVPENKRNYYAFSIDDDDWDWYKDERKPAYVTNSRRIQRIETQLTASGLVPERRVKAAATDTDAPCLAQFVHQDSVCADPLFKMYGGPVSLGSSIPAKAMDAFISRRCEELDTLASCRLSYFYNEYKSIRSGILGERAVQDVLDMHKGAFYVLNGLRIQLAGTDGRPASTVETDSLVLAPYGIFAIEIKNYAASGQYGLKITADGNWYKVFQRTVGEGGQVVTTEEPMSNPFAQNDRHVAYLEQVVNDILGRDMVHRAHIKNIIVLANDNVRIDCDPGAKQTVTRAGNLYNHLTQETKPLYTMEELDKLRGALAAMDIGEGAYPINDYTEELREAVSAYQQLLRLAKSTKTAIMQCFADHPEFSDLR